MKSITVSSFLFLGTLSLSSAHHGRDFLLAEDAHLPAPGTGHALFNFEWEHGDNDEYGLEPGAMIGVLPQVGLGVDLSFRDEGDGWEYSSVRPRLFFQLTPHESNLPFRAALSIGYQFVNGGGGSEGEEHHHDDELAMEEEEHHEEHSHAHGGVHNHDQDLLTTRLILETNLSDSTRLVFNLISILPDGGGADWGYAAGIRQTISDKVAVGLEAIGDFSSGGYHELVGAIYAEPISSLTVKLGAGFGLTDESPDFALHAGLNWRF